MDEIVILSEQLFNLRQSKAESQNEILALREAYEYKNENGCWKRASAYPQRRARIGLGREMILTGTH